MTAKKLTLVDRILAQLNLGEEGKVNHFFLKLIREEERAIVKLEHNVSVKKVNYTQAKEELEDKIEDAKLEVENTYLNLPIEELQTNASQDAYRSTYLAAIQASEDKLKELEGRLASKKADYEAEVRELEEQIAKRKQRILKFKS